MNQQFVVIIPARFDSTRLPGKPLLNIGSKPLIQHVYEQAAASNAAAVHIATDSDLIRTCAVRFGASVIMTSDSHRSGTERVAEACDLLGLADDCHVVNVQGDEFGLPPALINQVAANLRRYNRASMATLCEAIENDDDLSDPAVVKVSRDDKNFALCFSRTAIPFPPGAAGRHGGDHGGDRRRHPEPRGLVIAPHLVRRGRDGGRR